jgi:AraC family transcriptional regulator of adaptative response/methylated-DNA-[protein]-cysteine methyltransferase
METYISPTLSLGYRTSGSLPEAIGYAIGDCDLGAVLVARSPQGICAVFLDDDAPGLRMQLAQAFPAAALEEIPQLLQADLEQVIRLIHQQSVAAPITLDVGGTAFQQQVWAALCEIPAGQTRTYTQLAGSIGAPKAVRAVASACAANMLAMLIPCHRIVRSDGSLSGYRWGVQRKRAQLLRERG